MEPSASSFVRYAQKAPAIHVARETAKQGTQFELLLAQSQNDKY
jgi:hypothetical protein